jgi:predicted DNA-binding ribbon-helix-helix protein
MVEFERSRPATPRLTSLIKRSITLAGRKTSVTVEDEFWAALKEIADESGLTASGKIEEIDAARTQGNLSSAVRLFVLDHYKSRSRGA